MDRVMTEPRKMGPPPERKVAHICSWCDEAIYEGDDCWDMHPYGWACRYCISNRQTTAE